MRHSTLIVEWLKTIKFNSWINFGHSILIVECSTLRVEGLKDIQVECSTLLVELLKTFNFNRHGAPADNDNQESASGALSRTRMHKEGVRGCGHLGSKKLYQPIQPHPFQPHPTVPQNASAASLSKSQPHPFPEKAFAFRYKHSELRHLRMAKMAGITRPRGPALDRCFWSRIWCWLHLGQSFEFCLVERRRRCGLEKNLLEVQEAHRL